MENWCFAVRAGELEQHLTALSLKAIGSCFVKFNCLIDCLLAHIYPKILQNLRVYADWVSRANLRGTFIDRVCRWELEHFWMNSTGDSDQIHLLATANANATVRRLLDEMHQRLYE